MLWRRRSEARYGSIGTSIATLVTLGNIVGCDALMTFSPTTRYDNQLVRSRVTHVFTKETMETNWDKMIRTLPDAPSKEDYSNNYHRVTVKAETTFGRAYFGYPFVSQGLYVEQGDVVDCLVLAPDRSHPTFASRDTVVRIVCKHNDSTCLDSSEGRRRGKIEAPSPERPDQSPR
jgi:hypothetical protein